MSKFYSNVRKHLSLLKLLSSISQRINKVYYLISNPKHKSENPLTNSLITKSQEPQHGSQWNLGDRDQQNLIYEESQVYDTYTKENAKLSMWRKHTVSIAKNRFFKQHTAKKLENLLGNTNVRTQIFYYNLVYFLRFLRHQASKIVDMGCDMNIEWDVILL